MNKGLLNPRRMVSWFREALIWLAFFVGGRFMRTVILIGVVLVSALLLYAFVWTELQRNIQLPPAIPPVKPQIDVEVLQKLNEQRAAKTQQALPAFSQATIVFPRGSQPSPSPSLQPPAGGNIVR